MSLKRVAIGLLIGCVLFILVLVSLLWFGQNTLLYHPRQYSADMSRLEFTDHLIPYKTSQGNQTAFYFPAKNKQAAKHLWVMFNGNASLAFPTWYEIIRQYPTGQDAFLLIDYPGYGLCQGSPSPAAIEESADAALAALQQKLGTPLPPLRVIGHSLGAAAAMQFSAQHQPDRIILISPFTSVHEMGKEFFNIAPSFLIRHNFDNLARLDEIAKHNPQPRITILHGAADEVIPVRMGRELADKYPQMTTFLELPGIHHNDILNQIPLILQVMTVE